MKGPLSALVYVGIGLGAGWLISSRLSPEAEGVMVGLLIGIAGAYLVTWSILFVLWRENHRITPRATDRNRGGAAGVPSNVVWIDSGSGRRAIFRGIDCPDEKDWYEIDASDENADANQG